MCSRSKQRDTPKIKDRPSWRHKIAIRALCVGFPQIVSMLLQSWGATIIHGTNHTNSQMILMFVCNLELLLKQTKCFGSHIMVVPLFLSLFCSVDVKCLYYSDFIIEGFFVIMKHRGIFLFCLSYQFVRISLRIRVSLKQRHSSKSTPDYNLFSQDC